MRRMVRRRWRYRLNARCLVRPHQQHRTRRVVDDEASGVAQAVRTKTANGHRRGLQPRDRRPRRLRQQLRAQPVPDDEEAPYSPVRATLPRAFRISEASSSATSSKWPVGLCARKARPSNPAVAASVISLTSEGVTWRRQDLRVGGKNLGGTVEAALPCALDQPDDNPHWLNHPTNLSDTHKATVDASSTGGTVTTPRRRNSEAGSSSPCFRGTAKQGRKQAEHRR